jgi:cytochrome c553
MNKKLLIMLAIALVVVPVASSCGRTALKGQSKAQPIPHVIDVRFENCLVCHVADQIAAKVPFDHVALQYTSKDCSSLPICHALPAGSITTPPTKTTTAPPSTTPSTSTTPGGTTGSTGTALPPTTTAVAKTLPEVGLPNTTHSKAVLASYKGLCLMCHGQGMSNSQPYAPTWDGKASGSLVNTGVYTVIAGSKADHTGYTNETDCLQANCHANAVS